MSGLGGTQMGVKGAEGKPHDDLARGLKADLIKYGIRVKIRLRCRPIDRHELRFPAARFDELNKRFETFFRAGHGRGDGEGGRHSEKF